MELLLKHWYRQRQAENGHTVIVYLHLDLGMGESVSMRPLRGYAFIEDQGVFSLQCSTAYTRSGNFLPSGNFYKPESKYDLVEDLGTTADLVAAGYQFFGITSDIVRALFDSPTGSDGSGSTKTALELAMEREAANPTVINQEIAALAEATTPTVQRGPDDCLCDTGTGTICPTLVKRLTHPELADAARAARWRGAVVVWWIVRPRTTVGLGSVYMEVDARVGHVLRVDDDRDLVIEWPGAPVANRPTIVGIAEFTAQHAYIEESTQVVEGCSGCHIDDYFDGQQAAIEAASRGLIKRVEACREESIARVRGPLTIT